MITPSVPALGVHAGGVRMFEVLVGLARRGVEIHLTSFADEGEEESVAALEPFAREIRTFPRHRRPGARDPLYLLPDNYLWPEVEAHVANELGRCDALLVEHVELAHLVPARCPVPAVLTHHEVQTTTLWERASQAPVLSRQKLANGYRALRALHFESRYLNRFRAVVALTREDAAALEHLSPRVRIQIIPMGVNLSFYSQEGRRSEADTVLFVGFYRHPPNLEAGEMLLREIMPRVRRHRPGARLVLAGSYPPNDWLARRDEQTVVTGIVPDLRPYYHRASVFVAPILSGRGMRGKMLEAAACGVPIVASPLAAAGLGAEDGRDLLLAHDADGFAAQVEAVCSDPERAGRLAASAAALARAFTWERIADDYLGLLGEVSAPRETR